MYDDMDMPMASQAPTPSAKLSDELQRFMLASQTEPPMRPAVLSQKPPVPLFSQGPGSQSARPSQQGFHLAVGDRSASQLSYQELVSQDFITPADQDADQGDVAACTNRHMRSPMHLSPTRIKRARKDGMLGPGEDDNASLPPAGASISHAFPAAMPGDPPLAVRRPRAPKDPPCYRSMFIETERELEDHASWRAARPNATDSLSLSRFRRDFREIGMLGQGQHSKAWRVRHRLDGCVYVIKRTRKGIYREDPEFCQFLQECQVLAHVPSHPGIVKYLASWTETAPSGGEFLYIQLESCDDSLNHALCSKGMPEMQVLEIARQIAAALAHLHAHDVAHLDVKPDNIFMVHPTQDDLDRPGDTHDDEEEALGGQDLGRSSVILPNTRYKLGDFGQAARMGARAGGTEAGVREGDRAYLPLELMNSDFSRLDKADMFSLGATMYELASGTALPESGQAYQDFRRGKLMLLPTATTSFMKLVRALLSEDPEKRPSAGDVLRILQPGKKVSQVAAAKDIKDSAAGAMPLQENNACMALG